MEIKLSYREKTGKGSNRKLKAGGLVPAIIYGGKENIPAFFNHSSFVSFFLASGTKNKVIDLIIDKNGSSLKKKAIIQDYQYSNLKKNFLHVDFLEVHENTILHLDIPIKTVGTSIVSKMGGVMQTIRRTVPIKCKAKDIPEVVEIDITNLDFGSSIHVLDIAYPTGVSPVVTGRNFTLITTSSVTEVETAETNEVEAEDEAKVETTKQKVEGKE